MERGDLDDMTVTDEVSRESSATLGNVLESLPRTSPQAQRLKHEARQDWAARSANDAFILLLQEQFDLILLDLPCR
jgi:hypothetical protein